MQLVLSQAQKNSYKFNHITVNDGLSQSAVYDICFDDYGRIWFATRSGLSRYNGYEFENFFHDRTDSTSLTNNSIWSLLKTKSGEIWVGTSEGVNKFNWDSENFERFNSPLLNSNKVNDLLEFSEGVIWLATQKGILILDESSKEIYREDRLRELENLRIFHLAKRRNGDILISTHRGVWVYSKGQIKSYEYESVLATLENNIDNSVWILTNKNLFKADSDLKIIDTLYTHNKPDYIGSIDFDQDGNVVIANSNFVVFSPEGNLISENIHKIGFTKSLSSANTTCGRVNKQGIIWVATNGQGLNVYNPNEFDFEYIKNVNNDPKGLSSNYISSIFTWDDEYIYIGTNQGLNVFNLISLKNKKILEGPIPVLSGNEEELWVAVNKELTRIRRETPDELIRISIPELNRPSGLLIDNDILWISSFDGVWIYEISSGNSELLLPLSEYKLLNPGEWATSLFDSGSQIWVGTSSGLYLIDKRSKAILQPEFLKILKEDYIKSISADSRGWIWVGTWGDGLFKFEPETKTLTQYLRKDGLPDDVVYGVLEDEFNNMWMSTNNGLSQFLVDSSQFKNYGMLYELQSSEFNTNAYFGLPGGYLYFGGISGVNYFNPKNLYRSFSVPDTYISSISINSHRKKPIELGIEGKPIEEIEELVLPYYQNMVSVEFRSDNHTLSGLNQYAYQLENLEEDWNNIGGRRFAFYSSIPPGEYNLLIKSSNHTGQWDETPVQLKLVINPPYYMTWWFRTSIILLFLSFVYLIFKIRIRYLQLVQRRLKKEVRLKTAELVESNEELESTLKNLKNTQDQLIKSEKMASLGVLSAGIGHEINNPLNFIKTGVIQIKENLLNGEQKIDDDTRKLIGIVEEGVKRVSKIVHSLGHFSRSGYQYDEKCDLRKIIENCMVILHNRIKDRVEVELNLPDHIPSVKGNDGQLHQVFINILSNSEQAIEGDGKIKIDYSKRDEWVVIKVTDNGCGISDENLKRIGDPFFTTKSPGVGTGLGLYITYAIIEQHGGNIEIESEFGKGSEITLKFPLK